MKFDPFYHPKLYVIECVTPQHYYVGSTAQELYDRVDEHESGDPRVCCKWVHRHGFKRLVCWDTCTSVDCERLEDELTSYLMTWFGVKNVRGGNHNNCRPDAFTSGWNFWLPKHLRPGYVPALHGRVMSHFPLKLRRLVDRFERGSGLEHPDHVDSHFFPEMPLGRLADHDHHVLPAELPKPAPRAQQEPVRSLGADVRQELDKGLVHLLV